MAIRLNQSPLAYNWSPPDHGYLAWTTDPADCPGGSTGLGAGVLHLGKLHLPVTQPVTNLITAVGTAGATLTAGQCFAGLWRADGVFVAVTGDLSSAWTATGVKTSALAGGPIVLAPGDYYAGWWANGTTIPSMVRKSSALGSVANAGLGAAALRACTSNTGLTTTPPGTLGVQAASSSLFFFALS